MARKILATILAIAFIVAGIYTGSKVNESIHENAFAVLEDVTFTETAEKKSDFNGEQNDTIVLIDDTSSAREKSEEYLKAVEEYAKFGNTYYFQQFDSKVMLKPEHIAGNGRSAIIEAIYIAYKEKHAKNIVVITDGQQYIGEGVNPYQAAIENMTGVNLKFVFINEAPESAELQNVVMNDMLDHTCKMYVSRYQNSTKTFVEQKIKGEDIKDDKNSVEPSHMEEFRKLFLDASNLTWIAVLLMVLLLMEIIKQIFRREPKKVEVKRCEHKHMKKYTAKRTIINAKNLLVDISGSMDNIFQLVKSWVNANKLRFKGSIYYFSDTMVTLSDIEDVTIGGLTNLYHALAEMANMGKKDVTVVTDGYPSDKLEDFFRKTNYLDFKFDNLVIIIPKGAKNSKEVETTIEELKKIAKVFSVIEL